jgi:Beta-lactamase
MDSLKVANPSLPLRVAMAQINLPRRRFMHLLAGAAVLPGSFVPFSVQAQSEPTQSERAEMSNLARAFMQRYAMPGLSVAVGRVGAILYEDAFGWADRESRETVTSEHLFRIASVTKPITSVAIFSLIEAGRTQLTDKIFGLGAITGTDYGAPPYHPGVDQITVGICSRTPAAAGPMTLMIRCSCTGR